MTDADTPTVLFVSLPRGRGGSVQSLLTVLDGLGQHCRRVVARPAETAVARALADDALADATIDLPSSAERGSRANTALILSRWAWHHRRNLTAIHANGLSELVVAAPAARLSGVPAVVWVHDWQVSARQRRFARAAARITPIRWATVSHANRAALEAQGIPRGAPVLVIPNPIDPTTAPSPSPTPTDAPAAPFTVAYVGAPAPYKGFDLLPGVIDRVADLAPDARWDIWSGPRDQQPEIFAALADRAPRVTLHDKTSDVGEAYARADVVFCPSRSESFGRVAAEALAHGRALVATDLPALREVVGDAGVLVPSGDLQAAAQAIVALRRDPDRRAALGALGRAQVERFSPPAVVTALVHLYGLGRTSGRALVVSHDATRSGAPTVALDVVETLVDAGWDVTVGLRAHGPFAPALHLAAGRLEVEPIPGIRSLLRRSPRLRPFANRVDERVAARVLDRTRPDLVWANSTLSSNYVRPARARGASVVVHIHELGTFVPKVLSRYGLPGATRHDPAVRWVAASREAADQLTRLQVSDWPVVSLESSVDVAEVRRRAADGRVDLPAVQPTDGPPRTAVVGACGRTGPGKGTDLWLEVAARVHEQRPATRFVWIGPTRHEDSDSARDRGLGTVVHFTGELADPTPLLASLDVFTLPSRVDTFPLVVLEAMALARPVVAFDAGGARHQLGPTGVLVPPEDVEAFAAAVLALLDDPTRRRELGEAAHTRVASHFDISRFREGVGTILGDLRPGPMTGEP